MTAMVMKIRSHLILLVLGALLPLLIFAGVMTAVFWWQQRTAFEQRFLERVRAMAVALDLELEGSIRALEGLAAGPELDTSDLSRFHEQARRLLPTQPSWSTIILADGAGDRVLDLRHPGDARRPSLSRAEPFLRVMATGRPAISALGRAADTAPYSTTVAVPVKRGGVITHVLLAGIDQPVWRRFLSAYPVAPGATMTLLDQNGIVIARTLNNDQWVGKPAAPALYEQSRRSPEAAYRSLGLEQQWFYSAHSRSAVSGWTVATGVPLERVESALRGSTLAMAGGAALSAGLAIVLAFVFGRLIAKPIAALARSVRALAVGSPPTSLPPSRIAEIDEVTRGFEHAATLLREREQALGDALARERQARAECEEANRAKDQFLAVLSHELRTPMNAIFGWARMLQTGQVGTEALPRALDVIVRNSQAEMRLIDDLLDVSRIITGKMRLDVQPVALHAVIESAIDAVRPAAEAKEIRLQCVLDPSAEPIHGDPERLQQVVWNLLMNAVKFTPKGGRVQVSLQRVNSHVEIVVSDTGPGIPADVLPFIFERFRQADSSSTRSHAGLGLGLALVRHLVELHGGTVGAESAGDGAGATFRVTLPLPIARVESERGREHPTASRAAMAYTGPALHGVRVLMVDDDRDSLELASEGLGTAGAQIRICTSAAEAMEVFQVWMPDVLVSDIEMPGEDGYSLIRRVRALEPSQGGRVPAIALTAYGRPEDRMRTLSAGYSMHVPKPVDPAELGVVVASLTGRVS